ncbi:flagellar basal body P-ring formation chaperone FlgA [Oceanicoccus sagamiensis]|uniref:Flagella basal body P-ring formation protein FlgA n=1 Tax=Oceanicoccus sagamiensis TaxID=716816 RepID=A0A1X9N5Q7_9GAMM|nr:flagellar basal body P-ring formation chaperone FlgA [Oceanicoccus sagamiensis]ARN73066.1 flagella basal body P-ring formation protein FlgA [Oceanicoccus sagamiensis]
MIVRSFFIIFSALICLFNSMAYGDIGADDIKARVNVFMDDHIALLAEDYGDNVRIEYSINNLDSRLAMKDCPDELETELKSRNNIGRVNIRVSCNEQNPWSLYVPVEVDLYRPIVTTLIPVAKGEIISRSVLEMREMDISRLNGTYFTQMDDVTGMQAKRPLRADKPVTANYLEPPLLIRKGEQVQMTARSGGLVVKIAGVALTDGHKGEQISVRNNQSKRVVEARVSGPGQVAIQL